MTTARESILNGPCGKIQEGQKGVVYLTTLFKNFCRYARDYFMYDTNSLIVGSDVLASRSGTHCILNCESLTEVFLLMVKEDLGISDAQAVHVNHLPGFATKARSECFDPRIVGNVRTASTRFSDVRRCVFTSHTFVGVAGKFYDPCMVSIYINKKDVQSWVLTGAKYVKGLNNPYDNVLFKIDGDPSKLLIKIDPNWSSAPRGFGESFLLIDTNDLNKRDYEQAFGEPKPGWQMRTKSVVELLRAAGITVSALKV